MKLHHVALVVSSQEHADRFYEGILRLDKMKTNLLTSDLAQKLFGIDVECPLILYGKEDFAIEVFVLDRVQLKSSPLIHICLNVEDREEFLQACRSEGLTVRIVPRGDARICFIEDFDGNLFEIK